MAWTFDGVSVYDPRKAWVEARRKSAAAPIPLNSWWGKPNSYVCQLGGDSEIGYLLLLRDDLEALGVNDLCASSCAGNDDDDFRSLTIADHNQSATFPSIMIAGHCECISFGGPDDPRSLYLVPIADRRWSYWHHGEPISTSYNLRSDSDGSYLAGSLNGGEPWTWQQMLDDVWPEESGDDPPQLPFTPDGTPEGFWFVNKTDMQAHHFILVRLGCRLRYDPIADTFSIVRLGNNGGVTATAYRTLKTKYAGVRIWDDNAITPESVVIPETIRTSFRIKPVASDATLLYSAKDTGSGVTSGPVGIDTFVGLNDDLYDIGTNNAALTSRAGERANDFVRIKQFFAIDDLKMYSGMIGVDAVAALGETIEAVSWEDRGGPNKGIKTALRSGRASDMSLEDWSREEFPFFGCTQIEKVYGPVCWYGGSTLRRTFFIKQGCETLASGCEDVGNCNDLCSASGTSSGGGDGGPPINGNRCFCPDPPAQIYRNFTLSTISGGTCSGDCTLFNRNYCMKWDSLRCAWFYQFKPAPNAPCINPIWGTEIDGAMGVFPDGSGWLRIFSGVLGSNGSAGATYYISHFDCTGSNTFHLIGVGNATSGSTIGAGCNGWPNTILVSPDTTNLLCTNPPGGGHDCAACNVTTWSVRSVPSITDGTCTNCAPVGNSITLSLTSACVWESALVDEPTINCPGPSAKNVHYKLIDNGSNGWDLFITTDSGATVLAHYFTAYAAWDCAVNEMPRSGGTGVECNMGPNWHVVKLS